jgi:hypothetical protein
MFLALNDCEGLLASAKHLPDPQTLVHSFEAEVRGHLKEQVEIVKEIHLKLKVIFIVYVENIMIIYLNRSDFLHQFLIVYFYRQKLMPCYSAH